MSQNVIRDKGLIHCGVLVGLQGEQGIVGEGVLGLCRQKLVSTALYTVEGT